MSVRLGRSEGLRPGPVAFEVRLLRVRQHQDAVVGAVAHGGRMVAAVRRDPGKGDPRLDATALWTKRPAPGRAARRRCSTAESDGPSDPGGAAVGVEAGLA